MDKSEILVHISAPSGAVDDARYRAQVEAILNFQSHSREIITLTSPVPETADPSTIRNSSPLVQAAKRDSSQKDGDSLDTPVSVIPDSQPDLEQPGAESESLTLLPVAETPSVSACIPSKRCRGVSPPPVEHSPHVDGQAHCDTTTAWDHETIPAHVSPTTVTDTSTPTIPGEAKGNLDDEEQLQTPLTKPSAAAAAAAEAPPKSRGYPPLLPTLPLEIKPPPPPISSSPFKTHITPTLEMLSNRLKSPRTYNPIFQTRDLDTLERGYWYLRLTLVRGSESESENHNQTIAGTSSAALCWDKPLFTRFWTFLSEFICKEGRAGWGVWCILEDQRDRDRHTNGEYSTSIGPINAQFLSLKVYAWGEIASHIYLLLFLASERRIRKMAAQWRDGRDEVVIQMPGSGTGM
ncbi:hypothetical protein BDW68DRAFT_167348 [Aspergillus falconensis]